MAFSGVLPVRFQANRSEEATVSNSMLRQTVHAENINTVGYDRPTRVVEIEFMDGLVYRYSPVPVYIFRELLDADSKGGYIDNVIKPRFKSVGPVRQTS